MSSAVAASLAAFVVTLLSGLGALYLRAHKTQVYASCAGALIGGAVLFLLPDAVELLDRTTIGIPSFLVWLLAALGFAAFYALERARHESGSARLAGLGGGIGLVVHSFIDGVVIGQGFRAGDEIGLVLTLAVMLHRVADGASAVGVMLGTEHTLFQTTAMLLATAVAPLLGVLAQAFVDPPGSFVALLLSFFAGMLLYLAAKRLLPEALRASRSRVTALSFLALGFAVVWVAHLLSH